jgi:hypothetical protein
VGGGGGGGGHLPAKKKIYDGFLLMWCNFRFDGVLFRSGSRHNDRVDSLSGLPPSWPMGHRT